MASTTTHGVTIRSNARDAKRLSALVSATRNFEGTGTRGEFFIPADGEVQALRDAEFLTDNGATVTEVR